MTGIGGMASAKALQNTKILYCGGGTAVAAGAGDNTQVVGASVDRCPSDLEGGGQFDGAELVIIFEAALGAAEDLTFTFDLEHADDDGSDAPGTFANVDADYLPAAVVVEGNAGGTLKSQIRVPIEARALKRWLRCSITPNLSRGATDTVRWDSALVLLNPHNGVPIVQAVPALP